ncbi:hypothetical protein ACWGTI_30490 [Mesorhizobium sp. ArgA1]
MDGDHKATGSAKELVRWALRAVQPGETVSIKATIATVREHAPDLDETDRQLTELILFEAIFLGAFVIFDLHE